MEDASSSATAAWDVAIRSRGLVLDEMAARHRVARVGTDPELAFRAETLASARARLARLVVRGPEGEDDDAYLAELASARREKERAELELAAVSSSFRQKLARSRFGIEDLLALLSADEAVVAFVRYCQFPFDAFPYTWGQTAELTSPSYVAFVAAGPSARPVMVRLGSADEIDEAVSDLRRRTLRPAQAGSRSLKRAEASYREVGAGLRQKVWDPILPHVAGVEKILVIPDGALSLVNLAALPVGDSSYVVEHRPRIWHLSTERDLVSHDGEPTGEGLLAFGAPAFDETRLFAALRSEDDEWTSSTPVKMASLETYRGPRTRCDAFQKQRFEPLPSSVAEINEVAGLWAEREGQSPPMAGHPVTSTLRLSGLRASEAAFKTMASGSRILHLATHGFFLGPDCPSALDGENPLLLSGLALAGANHRDAAGPDEDDGILTAEEVASLDLSSVEWAVLSACDTGVGEVRAGEGVFGLRRAFQVAGARTLIMSLWPVEDEATRAWMRELYTNRFTKGMTTIDSVHEASLALLNERREKGLSTHPFYWAGFIASGDWR